MRNREKEPKKMPREIDRRTDRQTETGTETETEASIKSLDQSRQETDETVWEQYEAAIGLIDLKPNRIKE